MKIQINDLMAFQTEEKLEEGNLRKQIMALNSEKSRLDEDI